MKPKIEMGDRVIYKPCNLAGSVINRYRTTGMCAVVLDEDGISHYIHENDLEFENPKLTFLTRLQELLATFDAEIIGSGEGTDNAWVDIYIGGEWVVGAEPDEYCAANLTAKNIFDYDKA